MEDAKLARAAATGDRAAMDALIKRYRRLVYSIAWKITLNEEDAMDVAQNVFLKMMDHIASFNQRGPFRSWLASIAAHEAMNSLRRSHRTKEVSMDANVLETLSPVRNNPAKNNPRSILELKQRRDLVGRAMSILSPQQRAVLTLRLHQEMTPREIAAYLDIPSGQVRSQLCRAVCRLRDILAGTK